VLREEYEPRINIRMRGEQKPTSTRFKLLRYLIFQNNFDAQIPQSSPPIVQLVLRQGAKKSK
jgi:hypothetical protein